MLESQLDKLLKNFIEKGPSGVALSVKKDNQTLY